MILIDVTDHIGTRKSFEIPEDCGLNLMEALKANGYPVKATCGGMCLCSTCMCYIGVGPAFAIKAEEINALDQTPHELKPNSRLACQIKLDDKYDYLRVYLPDLSLS